MNPHFFTAPFYFAFIWFSHCQNKYTHMWKKNNDGQSLPRVGKVASGASRIGF